MTHNDHCPTLHESYALTPSIVVDYGKPLEYLANKFIFEWLYHHFLWQKNVKSRYMSSNKGQNRILLVYDIFVSKVYKLQVCPYRIMPFFTAINPIKRMHFFKVWCFKQLPFLSAEPTFNSIMNQFNIEFFDKKKEHPCYTKQLQ